MGLKIVFQRDRRYNTKLLHKDANLATWEVRARISANRLMFKYKFDHCNLEPGRPGTRAQSGPIFKIVRPNSKAFISSIYYKFRSYWNDLPPSIRIIDDYTHFNVMVKRYHISRYFADD